MKVILSRKGFDAGNSACPSPILPDGTMISMPIPDKLGNCTYDELVFPGGKSYAQIWDELDPGKEHEKHCHLDPDIRAGVRTKMPDGWIPAFGQTGDSQKHLENFGVKEGDLFLFFGKYRQTEYRDDGTLAFVPGTHDIHAIYGYMQIGEIVRGLDVRKLPWHPHSDDHHIYENGEITGNTIYLPTKKLVIDGEDLGLPGSGVFPFDEKRALTVKGEHRCTFWKLNGVFGKVYMTYHSEKSVHDGYFQSAKRGQEFVFDEDPRVTKWAKSLIL